MSSALRVSVILVLLLATAALGLIAYNAGRPAPIVVMAPSASASAPAPAATGYLVAARPLPAGTLTRDDDFAVGAAPVGGAPSGALFDTPDARAGLRGALVRKFLDTGSPITANDVLRPRDRGFLASVLAPDTRAVSIKVDAESGVSGLIWPGDYVDVVLTQTSDKADAAHRTLSEVVLHAVRIIAIDRDIVQGATANAAGAGKETHSVSLEVAPDEVKTIAVAKDLGALSLAIRSAVERRKTEDGGTTFGCDVSPEIARQTAVASQSATVMIWSGGKTTEFSVRKADAGTAGAASGCNPSGGLARGATLASRAR